MLQFVMIQSNNFEVTLYSFLMFTEYIATALIMRRVIVVLTHMMRTNH